MSLPIENLDDKTYAELVRDALARIPTYAPRWTDRNETDPGVTFIELFAWLADMQIYSLNRINDRSRLKFLKLLGVPRPFPTRPAEVRLQFTYSPIPGIDSAFYNNISIDLTRDSSGKMHVYPFGRRPQTGDIFYLSKATELSNAGSEIMLSITIEDPKPISASPKVTANLKWEYFNGSAWVVLSSWAQDHNAAHFKAGANQVSLVSLDDSEGGYVWIVPSVAVTNADTVSFSYKNTEGDTKSGSASIPAYTSAGTAIKAALVGTDKVVEITDTTYAGNYEYDGMIGFDIDENTRNLKDSGTIKFTCPNDIEECFVYGFENYWLRVTLASGDYGGNILYTQLTPPCLSDASFSMSGFQIPSGTWISIIGSGANDKIYFEVDSDLTIASGTGGGQYTAIAHAVQGVTKIFDSRDYPDLPLGTANLQIKLYEKMVLQEYLLRVKVNGETWQWVDDLSEAKATADKYVSDDILSADKAYKYYVANMKNRYILFGDGTNGQEPCGEVIEVYHRASDGFITRRLDTYPNTLGDQVQVDLTDRSWKGGCPKDPIFENIEVKVDGETWEVVDDFDGKGSADKCYVVDSRWIIKFAQLNSQNKKVQGMIPPSGASIVISYDFKKDFVAKLLGNDEKSWNTTGAANRMMWQEFTAIAGNFGEVRVKCVGSGNLKVAIYSDDAGSPGGLLGYSEDTVVAAGWNSISLNIQIALKATDYWLAVVSHTADNLEAIGTGGNSFYADIDYSDPFPDTAPTTIPDSEIDIAIAGWGLPNDPDCPTQPNVTGHITRDVISPGEVNFRLNLLDGPERLSLGDELKVKVQELSVTVAGETWAWVDDLSTTASTDKSYEANLKDGIISFGNGTHGMAPPQGKDILICYGGSIGYIIRHLISPGTNSLQVYLTDQLADLNLDSQHLEVHVDDETWEVVSSLGSKGPADKCYEVDSGTIKFGNGDPDLNILHGMIPPSGASLTITYGFTRGTITGDITREVTSPGEANFSINLLDSPQRDDLPWLYKEDLDASKYNDRHFTADPNEGIIAFGNGHPLDPSGRGRVPRSGSIITATYRAGVGAEGNLRADVINPIADNEGNQSLVGMTVTGVEQAKGGEDAETMNEAIERARKDLLEVTRCISASDYETLAMECPRVELARVKTLPQFHPTISGIFDLVSVVIVPVRDEEDADYSSPTANALECERVRRFLEQFRTLGTNLYVFPPAYNPVEIIAKVVRDIKYSEEDVKKAVEKALHAFLNPLTGGPDGGGWPFGRSLYQSEIMQVIDKVAGVDHVVTATMRIKGQGSYGTGPLEIGSLELIYSEHESDNYIDATEAVT